MIPLNRVFNIYLSNDSHRSVNIHIVLRVSRFEPALILNRFLADQRPGLNTLNSASGGLKKWSELPCKSEVSLQIVRGWIKWAPDCKRVRILSQFKLSCLRERILNKITF